MKIVLVDDFNRETVNDVLLKDNLSLEEANKIAEEYNKNTHSGYFALVKEDTYILYEYDPNK